MAELSEIRIALASFVKTPGLSPVKTRLASGIGKEKAKEFYKDSIAHTENILKNIRQIKGVEVFWAVAEEEALNNELWSEFKCIAQGEGGLGNRLSKVYNELLNDYDVVILIGSDCMVLRESHICSAIVAARSKRHSVIIGPTVDGGYYLFASGLELDSSYWVSINYSIGTTKDETIEQLPEIAKSRVYCLEELFDIDTLDDYQRFKNKNI